MVAQAELTAYAEEIRRTAEGTDESWEQWERLRRRLGPQPQTHRAWMTALCQHYQEKTGTVIGCD
jgi:hypothetical protein